MPHEKHSVCKALYDVFSKRSLPTHGNPDIHHFTNLISTYFQY
ncbi:hypothetical protein Echvi_0484 [Echinicola vietnamensis DSM 17526]|uniref:Uncharacterized protein n=1 Tax=Echinicola vietnamensis (strain DSM 17526 / LMG 23754 / KMM 6221) TaxID=926556 RepID=L0FUQ8_ECHVK|nr:hypothetical protein Echvi_0484 [Echinicola vietnamensis DSM 17526]